MKSCFPPSLLITMEKAVLGRPTLLVSESGWLHAAMSPEAFNSLAEDKLVLIRAKYAFNPPEHGDWVHPSAGYFADSDWQTETEVDTCLRHPLNSFILKDPISPVPTLSDILALADHMHMLVASGRDKTSKAPTAEELHDNYMLRVCEQLKTCDRLLQEWILLSSPRMQEECVTFPKRKIMLKIRSDQEKSVIACHKIYNHLMKNLFPQFVIDWYFPVMFNEEKILDGMNQILS